MLDVANPAAPAVKGTLASVAPCYALAVEGTPQRSVGVIDITNPAAPVLTGQIKTDGLPNALVIHNGYLYAAMAGLGIAVIELSSLAVKTVFKPAGIASAIAVADPFLYVTTSATGTVAYDISNPASPVKTGTVKSFFNSTGVAVSNPYCFIADGTPGVYVVKNTDAVAETAGPAGSPGSKRSRLIRFPGQWVSGFSCPRRDRFHCRFTTHSAGGLRFSPLESSTRVCIPPPGTAWPQTATKPRPAYISTGSKRVQSPGPANLFSSSSLIPPPLMGGGKGEGG